MIKKIFPLFLLGIILLSTTCQARTACEWESEDAVSYSMQRDKTGAVMQFRFVNYATADGKNEYWLRVSRSLAPSSKILHWASIFIDDEEYKLIALKAPEEKHRLAGSSACPPEDPRINPRYFSLCEPIVTKLLNAKEVYITYNMQKSTNKKVVISERELKEIKEMLNLKFSDFKDHWNPKDKGED